MQVLRLTRKLSSLELISNRVPPSRQPVGGGRKSPGSRVPPQGAPKLSLIGTVPWCGTCSDDLKPGDCEVVVDVWTGTSALQV